MSEGDRIRLALEGGDSEVLVDSRLLVLCLTHLLENALRYSEANTPVILSAGRGEGGMWISVRDYSEGIPPEVVERMFDPFTRLKEMDKHKEGMGLGLYIVRLAVEMLGMDIRVDSRPGEGSTFRLRLPAAAQKDESRHISLQGEREGPHLPGNYRRTTKGSSR